jgi:CBS domain-containing protein
MKVRDIMSTPIVAVPPGTPVRELARLLLERQISAVPIVDGERRLLGLVSEADLLPIELVDQRRQASPEAVPERAPETAGELMTKDVISVPPDLDVGEAARVITTHRLRHVPVVEDGRVTGMLSRRDLLGMLTRGDAEVQAEIEGLLASELGAQAPAVHVRRGELEVALAEDAPAYRLVKVLATSVPGVVAVRGR